MAFFLDARSAEWSSVCDAIVRFNAWREHNSGYFYIRPQNEFRRAIAELCARLDLDDAYSFVDEDHRGDAAWVDLAAGRWSPPPG